MDGFRFENLKNHILNLSESKDFVVACSEWILDSIEISEELDNCPCGQSIKEHCYIKNKLNNKTTYVGNKCIKRFMQKDEDNLFSGMRRIKENPRANANQAVIDYAQRKGYLHGENEYNFLMQTKNKRKLSDAQLRWKEKINHRILGGIVVKKRTVR